MVYERKEDFKIEKVDCNYCKTKPQEEDLVCKGCGAIFKEHAWALPKVCAVIFIFLFSFVCLWKGNAQGSAIRSWGSGSFSNPEILGIVVGLIGIGIALYIQIGQGNRWWK